jgi:dihydroneopterin aldolase
MSRVVIELPQLTLPLKIGVYPNERDQPQLIDIALKLTLAFCPATRTDRLEDTLDYDQVIGRVEALAQAHAPQLLEHFAGLIAEDLLLRFAVLESVSLRLRKVLKRARPVEVDVSLCRTRGDSE